MEKKGKTLIVIVGPTAVGKTGLAIKLARIFSTEILSADARQIYSELEIGTAKPSKDELATVTHHFINSHSITEDYDAAQYSGQALTVISQLFQKHNIVILCGGSGLYVQAVCDGFDDIPETPAEIREQLIKQYEQQGIQWLQEQMADLDPIHFEVIDKNNPHRLIRALEVRLGTGSSIASYRTQAAREHSFDILKIGLELPRDELYARIDTRMDQMIEEGLFEEARQLYAFKHKQALQTVGYREIFDFMDNKYDRQEAIRLLKRNSRRYAKRQLTWFKRDPRVNWFSANDSVTVIEFIKKHPGIIQTQLEQHE